MLGRFKLLDGKAGTWKSSAAPVLMLQQMKRNVPLPITISGSNQVTFTLNCSVTNPMSFWNGYDYFPLKRTLTYTWTASTTNAILSSAGAYTASQAPATGIWYYYVGIDIAGDAGTANAIIMIPSQTGPSYVEDEFGAGHLAHPGASKTMFWNYVGFHYCSATTPVFEAATKLGFRYMFAATNHTSATATTWAELALALPKIGALGGKAGGHLNCGAAGTITVGSTSSATVGIVKALAPSASGDHFMPLPPLPITANGKLYANHATAAGDVSITFVDDVV